MIKILRHPKTTEAANYLQSEKEVKRTTAARYYIQIKRTPVIAILDSGAAVSIITKKLMDKLRLSPDAPSETVVITANGMRTKALGQISNLKISIQDLVIPIQLQVIESREETFLLGIDWFEKIKAKWDFDTRTLQICYQNKCINIGTTHFTNTPPQNTLINSQDND